MYPENKSDKADNAITDQRLIIVLSSVSRIVEAINLKKGWLHNDNTILKSLSNGLGRHLVVNYHGINWNKVTDKSQLVISDFQILNLVKLGLSSGR